MNTLPCLICNLDSQLIYTKYGFDGVTVECIHCGVFDLSGTLMSQLPAIKTENPLAIAKLSHGLRNAQKENAPTTLTVEMCDAILKMPLPKPKEQADLMIRWLAESHQEPGQAIRLNYVDHGAIIGSQSATNFAFTIEYMIQSGFLNGEIVRKSMALDNRYNLFLTIKGWDIYDGIKTQRRYYRKAFMAMKFNDAHLEKHWKKYLSLPSRKLDLICLSLLNNLGPG